jgi:hypothetical protein
VSTMCNKIIFQFTCGHLANPNRYGIGTAICLRAQRTGYECVPRVDVVYRNHPVNGICEECLEAPERRRRRQRREEQRAAAPAGTLPCSYGSREFVFHGANIGFFGF